MNYALMVKPCTRDWFVQETDQPCRPMGTSPVREDKFGGKYSFAVYSTMEEAQEGLVFAQQNSGSESTWFSPKNVAQNLGDISRFGEGSVLLQVDSGLCCWRGQWPAWLRENAVETSSFTWCAGVADDDKTNWLVPGVWMPNPGAFVVSKLLHEDAEGRYYEWRPLREYERVLMVDPWGRLGVYAHWFSTRSRVFNNVSPSCFCPTVQALKDANQSLAEAIRERFESKSVRGMDINNYKLSLLSMFNEPEVYEDPLPLYVHKIGGVWRR